MDVVRKTNAAFKAGDKEALSQLIIDDVVWHANEGNPEFGGTINGIQAFFDQAFKYVKVVTHVDVTNERIMTDGEVVMTRQRDDITRIDGSKVTYWFNVYFEFNDDDKIKSVWEVCNANWVNFP
jgi:ketosteroid isomerase-like protein